METPSPQPPHQTTLALKLDWRVVSALLLVIIGAMLWLWKPWAAKTPTKTITVRGEAIIEHEPDLFRFQPIYQDTDKTKLTATGNTVVAEFKKLGVKDADIKTDVSSYDNKPVPLDSSAGSSANISTIYPRPGTATATYTIIATVGTKDLAQKVADYLATTGATGQATPQADFTKSTRTKLDLQARAKASDDAKAKAKASAGGLDAKVGKVVSISESGYGIMPLEGVATDLKSSAASSGPTIQPGTGEVTYSFTVV
jgi:uncharacterized protein YggE